MKLDNVRFDFQDPYRSVVFRKLKQNVHTDYKWCVQVFGIVQHKTYWDMKGPSVAAAERFVKLFNKIK